MSWQIVSEVYKAKLGSPTRKAVAAKLADYADRDGCGIYPTVHRIADETETSVRTVQNTVKEFVTEGLVTGLYRAVPWELYDSSAKSGRATDATTPDLFAVKP